MSEVLALKYRPQSFVEVIGQEGTIQQITSALEKDNLGHSLLFSGTRGTGKTTVARILAKAFNCENREGVEPCRRCIPCKTIEAGVNLAITEIDAASNTGVDNVRDIIERVRYSVVGKRRVVILDEAHMLSKNAFNALLKTLEEPPPDVTFILVTTEPNKLIPTVVSRCQKYEFHNIDLEVLKAHFRFVAETEGLPVTEEGLTKLALDAEGSVRDGLTTLQTTGEAASDSSQEYFNLVGAIYNQDVITALDAVAALRKANEPRTIIQTLEKWFYWCSLESFGMKTPVRDYFSESAATSFDLGRLQESFKTCLEVERNFTATPNSKIVLDMGVIKLCL
jgi:DNA polymerase III subunit gamma/tau